MTSLGGRVGADLGDRQLCFLCWFLAMQLNSPFFCRAFNPLRVPGRKAKISEPSPAASSEDPSAGIMNLLQKMYEEGDDDMKRNLSKAWTESRVRKQPDGIHSHADPIALIP